MYFTTNKNNDTRFKHSLEPFRGIDLGFYNSFLQPYVCNCLWSRMVHHENIFEREGQSIEKLDSLFVWTVLATLLGARLGHVFFMTGNISQSLNRNPLTSKKIAVGVYLALSLAGNSPVIKD
jgi:hypothetical protein